MENRGFDGESTRRRHGSHRRPHGAEEARMNNREFDDGSMADFVESLEGMNMGSRHQSTRLRYEDSQGEANHRDSSVEDREARHAKHRHVDYRHGEHRHGGHRHEESRDNEYRHGERQHEEHRHKEHRDKEHRHREHQHGEHPHNKHPHKEHRPGEHRHEKHGHKEHRHGEHRHGKHRSEEQEFNKKLYDSALLHFRENSGSFYPCKQSEIDFHYRGVFDKPNKGPFVTAMQATEEVMRWNDEKRAPPRDELDIIRTLTIAVHDAEKNLLFGPDLIIKAFADLDRVFFGGRLRGHVVVQWFNRCESGGKPAYGLCSYRQPGQCLIKLSAELILLRKWSKVGRNPVALMFGTMLHEMCHAYEHVRCPNKKHEGDPHDRHFGTKLRVVHDRAIRILGTWAIGGWEPYRDNNFFSKEGEKSRKVGTNGGHDGGKKYDGGEKKRVTGPRSGGQKWETRKGSDCIIM